MNPRPSHAREGPFFRALLLVLLLMGGSVALLVPPAAGQAPVTELCFFVDPDANAGGAEEPVARCGAELQGGSSAANYLQGDHVDVTLRNVTVNAWIRVKCLTSCHETQGKSYFALYTPGATLRFPRDFNDPRGSNAVADRAPRYNGTWEAVALIGEAPVARGTFNVWVFDRYVSQGLTVMPGERHVFRASGFDAGAQVTFRLERRVGADWVTAFEPPGSLALFTSGGFSNHVYMPAPWTVPKEEGERFAACADRDSCYRVVVRGAGKADENVTFRVAPAALSYNRANALGNSVDSQLDPPRPPAVERTKEVHVGVELRYPGGNVFFGAPLTPADMDEEGKKTLRVRVERVNGTASTPTIVRDVPMQYVYATGRWEARWVVPKDFPVQTSEPDAHYRFRLMPDRDRWGNRVPDLILANHTIDRATLTPVFTVSPIAISRTEEANVTVNVLYHNGSALGPDDLAAPLRGCFVREAAGDPLNCARANETQGEFRDGKWVFKVRYPRDHPNLDEHRFHLAGGNKATDKWGNVVQSAKTEPYRVVEGSPRVSFATISRGREVTELERGGGSGNHVVIHATITYGDGAPFNRFVNQNESGTLPGALVKRAPGGTVLSQQTFNLREVDSYAGRWAGEVVLTADDATTPVGTWEWRFEVRDNLTNPNVNRSAAFTRDVKGIPLLVEPIRQPFPLIETDATQSFRFRIRYQDGHEVPHTNLVDQLSALVYRYDPARRSLVGEPVSARLIPQYDHDNRWYQVQYKVPNNLFSGTYVFVLAGADRYGNALPRSAFSDPFGTTSKTLERPVLTQPPPEVLRGESATVVIDAREGDVGLDGTGRVSIRVERHDASLGQWVVERANARQDAPDLVDHVGLFPVTTTTPVGLYRFVLVGRDANLQGIVATSGNFTVAPTEVPRVILSPPPARVVKGASFHFVVERQDGDRFTEARVLLNGRAPAVNGQPLALPLPVVVPTTGGVNVTWQVPFEAPGGNYSILLAGLDLFGNRLEVLSPAVEAEAAQLQGRILGNPGRSVERGEAATLLFGITYPTGAYYPTSDAPVVQVMNASGFVDFAEVRREGLTFLASWVPSSTTAAAEHWFEIAGTGVSGNAFPSLRSTAFRVIPGAVTRSAVADLPATMERMAVGVFSVPFDARDRFVEFRLAYYGPATDATGAVFETRDPQTETPLAHTLEPENGRYVTRFITDHTTQPGLYRIFMRGEDGNGNELRARSAVLTLVPTSILILPDPWPDDDAFGDGRTITVSFVARYKSGLIMDESHGRPSAVVLYTAPGRPARPVTDRPDVEFREGRWYVTWTAPDLLPEGLYEFSFGGTDLAGNVVGTQKSKAYPITETLTGSAAKLLPGPPVGLIVIALGALALTLRRRKR